MSDVAANLQDVHDVIDKTAHKWRRKVEDIDLIAVSKKQPHERVVAALEAGHRLFGENRVQEAKEKWPDLKAKFENVELHLIGPLQTNKAKEAVALFDVIQTVDRPKLARLLAKEMKEAGKFVPVYIQVNIGEEEQKSGISIEEADRFIKECREEYGLTVIGLMCIPPAVQHVAPYFALLGNIAARNNIDKLSMGMSGDYATAIQFGATSVRVGTGIFGDRIAQ
ncbi:MAG: YggS family pyridoxal phosphate-dependent enzyme [Sneathiella sp.]